MARTPNRTGMGDSYKKGGKKKKKITYMQDGGKAAADQDYTSEDYSRPPVELFKLPKGYEFGKDERK